MADNSFKIVARLDIPASMPVIKDDIKSLSEQLKSDKNARAKIVAGLDVDKSRELIKSQLDTITNQANAPTIKVGIDVASANGNNLKPEIKPILDRTAFKDVESYINAISEKLSQVKIADPSSIVKNIKDSLGVNSPEVKNAVTELVNALKLTPNNKAAIVDSYQNLIESIRGTIDSSKIVNDKNFEKNLADEIYRSATAFKDVQTQAQQTSSSVVNNLQQIQVQATQTGNAMSSAFGVGHFGKQANEYVHSQHQIRTTFDDTLNVVKEAETYFQKFGTVSVDSVEQLGRNGALKQFTINVESATGAVEKFKYVATKIGDDSNSTKIFELQNVDASNAGIQRLVKSTEEAKIKYSRLLADFKSSNSAIQSGLTTPIAEFERVLSGLGKTSSISDVKNAFESLKKSASEITAYLDTTNSSFNKSTNAINNYKNMDNILKEMSTSFDNLTIKPNNLKTELDGVKTKLVELQNLEKTEGGYTKAWAEKYREVNLELSRVKANIELAAKAESKSQKADKNSAYQTQLKYLNKIKEETNTIISLKKKMVNAGAEESAVYQHEITKAQKRIQYDVQQLQKKKLLTDEAQRIVNTYKEEIALQDKINSAKSSDKAIQQRIADMKSYQKQIETAISSLNQLNNSTVFRNNSSNPQVAQTKQELVSLRAEYQQLLTQLQANPTSQGLEALHIKLTELDNRMKTAVNSAKAFEKQVRSDNSADQLAKKVNVLTQQMKAYQATNTKAAKAYKQQFSDMFAILNNPNIDNQAFTTVQKQFQALRQEAIATGKVGKTMFQTISDAVKKFAGWMSMTYLVSSFARSLRDMVNNVIELDSAMTNLKKVTNETEVTYSKFLKSVSKQAKELHSTMTDLIEQVATWSKLGYSLSQAEHLAKVSMIYSKVGEVDNTTAVSDLVTVMKANIICLLCTEMCIIEHI